MKKYLIKTVLVVSAVLAGMWAKAADTDLFALGGGGGNVANVLFIMDNAANFSASVSSQRCSISPAVGDTPGTVKTDGTGAFPTNLDGKAGAVEQCALYAAIGSLSTATVTLNVGIMMFNDTGMKDFDPIATVAAGDVPKFNSNCAVSNVAGCLVSPMVAMNKDNKRVLLEYIRKWDISGAGNFNVKANNAANGAAMQEAWAYFNGKMGLSGRNYAGAMAATPCPKNNIIFVGNDYRNNATAGDATGDAGPKNALFGINTTAAKNATPTATTEEKASITGTIPTPKCPVQASTLQTAENAGAYALNWARYMKNQGSLIYSIGILGPTCNEIYAAHLTRMGDKDVGGGKYFATTNYAELVAAIQTALSEIQSVNSVFASVSLPLNANVQGQFLNQVFIGMFRPDKDFLPRWPGNLKQYKLGFIGADLKLLDASPTPTSAINNVTGFVTACARSFWTSVPNAASDTYWINAKAGDCVSYEAADSPDGAVVEKGAQAHMLRDITPSSRNVKTCAVPGTFGSCTLTDFATSTVAITQAMVSATSATERDTYINWIRGTNVEGELAKSTSVMRPYVHGDIVHSRPVALNYGAGQVVVFYGGNDGMLRAINGARTATFNVSAGSELWSFMPPQFYDKIARLKNNTIPVSFPNSPAVTAQPKDYGMDGPISALQGTVSGVSTAYVFGTMRRGGRVIYAFDVTDPVAPVGLWQKGCPNLTNDTGCSTGYTQLGQTWATAKPMYVAAYEGGATAPLLIMGGGYDTCEDYDAGTAGGANHNCGGTPKGNKIYVINATTGAVIRAFDTARSVVGDPTLVTDANGKVVYAYATDLGGNIYRLKFDTGASGTWTNTKIAALGCDNGVSTCTANRKFEFQPSVVTTDGERYYVMVGSGEREKPVEYYLAAKAVTNYFFMIMDEPGNNTWLTSGTCAGNVICKPNPAGTVLLDVTNIASPTAAQMSGKKGWYLGFAQPGEQVVTSAITIFGTVNFSTHQPAVYGASTCKPNLGETRLYKRDYLTGKNNNGTNNQFEDVAGDGLPPSPVGGQVVLDDGTVVPFCIGCSKDSPLEGTLPKPANSVIQPKNRLYWYIQK